MDTQLIIAVIGMLAAIAILAAVFGPAVIR